MYNNQFQYLSIFLQTKFLCFYQFYARVIFLKMYREKVLQYHKPTVQKELVDMVCGSFSGFSYCLSGYILDTVKVRMQMEANITSKGILKQMIYVQGFKKLFNGIYYPITTVPLVNAIVFGSYELYKKMLGKTQLSFINGIQSGAFGGLINSFVVCPVEYIKCIMQTDKDNKFRNSKDCLKYIIKRDGFFGIFRGLFSTIVRQVPCYAGQFAAYEQLKSLLINEDHLLLSFVEGALIGGVAGVNCWILSYPQDLIKTRIQLADHNYYKVNRFIPDDGFISCGGEILRKDGWKGFWRGIQPCIIRGFLANAFGIAVYEKSQQLFQKSFQII